MRPFSCATTFSAVRTSHSFTPRSLMPGTVEAWDSCVDSWNLCRWSGMDYHHSHCDARESRAFQAFLDGRTCAELHDSTMDHFLPQVAVTQDAMHFAWKFQGVQAAIWRAFGVWDGAFRTGSTATSRLPAMFPYVLLVFKDVASLMVFVCHCCICCICCLSRRWHFNKSCISRIPLPCGPFFWRHGEQILMDCHRHVISIYIMNSSWFQVFTVVSWLFMVFLIPNVPCDASWTVGRIVVSSFFHGCLKGENGEMAWLQELPIRYARRVQLVEVQFLQ